MDKQESITRKSDRKFFSNSNVDINLTNFVIAIIISAILAYVVKFLTLKYLGV